MSNIDYKVEMKKSELNQMISEARSEGYASGQHELATKLVAAIKAPYTYDLRIEWWKNVEGGEELVDAVTKLRRSHHSADIRGI